MIERYVCFNKTTRKSYSLKQFVKIVAVKIWRFIVHRSHDALFSFGWPYVPRESWDKQLLSFFWEALIKLLLPLASNCRLGIPLMVIYGGQILQINTQLCTMNK